MANFAMIPERTALINIDLQNCFADGYASSAPDGLGLLDRINRLAAVCRAANVLVIHTSHVLRPDGSNMGVLGEVAPPSKSRHPQQRRPISGPPRLVVDPRDILLDKPRFGAFHGTDLELILRARGINTVIIAGIATNVCCETTARKAAVRPGADDQRNNAEDQSWCSHHGRLDLSRPQEPRIVPVDAVFRQWRAPLPPTHCGLRRRSWPRT
jgi:ureidoacrylate peracid hydrolase